MPWQCSGSGPHCERHSLWSTRVAYLPDHEPALGARRFPLEPDWTSGSDLIRGVHLLLHDAQYTREEYPRHVGWGHSTIHDALALGRLANVKHLVPFRHDPGWDDDALDAAMEEAVRDMPPNFPVTPQPRALDSIWAEWISRSPYRAASAAG